MPGAGREGCGAGDEGFGEPGIAFGLLREGIEGEPGGFDAAEEGLAAQADEGRAELVPGGVAEDEEAALEKGQEHAEMHGSPGFHLDGEEIDSVEVEGFAQ